MQCTECQAENSPLSKFCENCGKPLPKVISAKNTAKPCPSCGKNNTSSDKFCLNCGAALNKKPPRRTKTSLRTTTSREERYRQARQLALKMAQEPGAKTTASPIIYIGEKIT